MSGYITVAKKAGEHIFIGEAKEGRISVRDWRVGAIHGPCQRICLRVGGGLRDMKLIGMDAVEREHIRALIVALSNTGMVNIGLTDEGADGRLRFVIFFPDQASLERRMKVALDSIA